MWKVYFTLGVISIQLWTKLRFSGIFVLMLKLALNGPMAKNESTITCLIVNEVHSMHPGLNGAASFTSLP
ncbi:unnamed protein product [Porites lobata]|uniref:Uncharacterized protein n=1 Tax=Porites lobata TaxID=104759 RepID=A0ABN8QIV6_9CNID|nr:unnamed protein product [Porites lobata]